MKTNLRKKIYIKSEEILTSCGVIRYKPDECNKFLFVSNDKIYKLICDEEGNVISRIEVSFNDSRIFTVDTYKDIVLGAIFPKSNNKNSIIDKCCLEIKIKDKHKIIFEGEKKFGRVIYIEPKENLTEGRFVNDDGKRKRIIGFNHKWDEDKRYRDLL